MTHANVSFCSALPLPRQAALDLGCHAISVRGDSTLIIRQLLGDWRVKHEGLMPYHAAALALRRRFASFEARQIPR